MGRHEPPGRDKDTSMWRIRNGETMEGQAKQQSDNETQALRERLAHLEAAMAEMRRRHDAVVRERDVMRALFNNLPERAFVKDTSSRFIAANEAMVHHRGNESEDELLGRTDFDFYPYEEAAQYFADERELLESGEPLEGHEETETNSGGRTRWKLTTKVALRDADGQIVGLAGISRDITDRKLAEQALHEAKQGLEVRVAERTAELATINEQLRNEIRIREMAEEALRESERKFRSLAQTASDAVVTVDHAGKVVFWNRAAEAIFGYKARDMVGADLERIMPDRYRQPHMMGLHHATQSGRFHLVGRTSEFHGLRRDGTEFPLELSLSTWESGGKRFYTGIMRDITLRKKDEDELRRLTGQLRDLTEAAKRLNANLEAPAILHVLVQAALKTVNATGGAAGLLEQHAIVYREYQTRQGSRTLESSFEYGQGVAGWILQNCEPYLCKDASSDAQVDYDFHKAIGFRKVLALPLLDRAGDPVGCFEIHDPREGRDFNEQDVEMLKVLADLASTAVENARLLDQRGQTEAALRRSEERFELLAHAAFEALVIHENGTLIQANRAFGELFGYDMDELRGQDIIARIVCPDKAEEVRRHIRETPEEPYEIDCFHKDGTRIRVKVYAKNVNYQGRPVHVVSIKLADT